MLLGWIRNVECAPVVHVPATGATHIKIARRNEQCFSARTGIRIRVDGLRVHHDGPLHHTSVSRAIDNPYINGPPRMGWSIQFHQIVNLKNATLRRLSTFIFSFRHLLFFIGSPTLEPFMQTKQLQQNETVSFATLVATRRPRSPKEGALVHASGNHENGRWKPLGRPTAWNHIHKRSLEAMA